MFLSEFDFKLDYAPGKKNPADAPSRCPDFIPQEGDEVVKFQNKSLLTDCNLDCNMFHHVNIVLKSRKSLTKSMAYYNLLICPIVPGSLSLWIL